MRPGRNNLITDVDGLQVGNAHDRVVKSGVTVLIAETPFAAGVHVMGGAPGTRETDLLAPDKLVAQVDALVLSGGSALGLSAASGVADALRATGRGFDVGGQRVPIVPAAILFDLLNGGAKDWDENPYASLGAQALAEADETFAMGTAGAGAGATTADLKGGLGSASVVLPDGTTVGALVAVNAVGSVCVPGSRSFWAAPFEMDAEFGMLGSAPFDATLPPPLKTPQPGEATTIAIVATDAKLDKAGCTRLATAAHDGLARAILPAHTPFDGDLVFGVSHGDRSADPVLLCHAAALCLSRAVARGVFHATPEPGDVRPCWSARS